MRPVIEFDPNNKTHRKQYQTFLETGTWAKCPVMFKRGRDYSELPHYLNQVLLQWYMQHDGELHEEKDTTEATPPQSAI